MAFAGKSQSLSFSPLFFKFRICVFVLYPLSLAPVLCLTFCPLVHQLEGTQQKDLVDYGVHYWTAMLPDVIPGDTPSLCAGLFTSWFLLPE